MDKDIFVTKPYLPPLEEYIPYLETIWENRILTNCGPFHHQLEQALCEYLGVKYISLFSNGTIALVVALLALKITGEVITTPFSFVATSHSLLWNRLKPVFVDIDPRTLNIDPSRIEAAITQSTTAIMPVHCYGHPCDVDAISKIADKYNLKVIYDAAHAFGVQCETDSVLNYGDLSVLSFHATKVFNTVEGGAIISSDAEMKDYIDKLKNFGHEGETKVLATGINGKMSELNAALGLLQLKHIDEVFCRRKNLNAAYCKRLGGIRGIRLLNDVGGSVANYSYFPILVCEEYPLSRDELYFELKKCGINTRRYFYPLISEFPMYRNLPSAKKDNLVIATDISRRVLCLPIYPDLELQDIDRITSFIITEATSVKKNQNRHIAVS